MWKFRKQFVILTILITASWLAAQPVRSTQSQPQTFRIDPIHSTVLFKIRHLGVSNFYGRFNKVSGGFTWDETDSGNGSMRITVEAKNVDTGNLQRDIHLMSEDFFNAEEFPTISFISKGIEKTSTDTYTLRGDLTMRGVRKPITASMTWLGIKDTKSQYGIRAGFEATFTIKRSEFGMDGFIQEGILGDEVTLTIALEGMRK